jgi:hypothetical protein
MYPLALGAALVYDILKEGWAPVLLTCPAGHSLAFFWSAGPFYRFSAFSF